MAFVGNGALVFLSASSGEASVDLAAVPNTRPAYLTARYRGVSEDEMDEMTVISENRER